VQLSDDEDEDDAEEAAQRRVGASAGGFDTAVLGAEGQGFIWKCGDEGWPPRPSWHVITINSNESCVWCGVAWQWAMSLAWTKMRKTRETTVPEATCCR
jgi:hypothetical protein